MRRTTAQREEALALVAEVGAAEAARRLGIPKGTVDAWASRRRVAGRVDTAERRAQVERQALTMAERKTALAEGLMGDIERLRAQLWAPCVERKAMAVGPMREVEIVDIALERPAFTDQRAIMTSIAIAVDKVQILTGEATERIETLTGRTVTEDAVAVVDELAARRAS